MDNKCSADATWNSKCPRVGDGGGEKYIEVMMDTKSSEKKCGGNM